MQALRAEGKSLRAIAAELPPHQSRGGQGGADAGIRAVSEGASAGPGPASARSCACCLGAARGQPARDHSVFRMITRAQNLKAAPASSRFFWRTAAQAPTSLGRSGTITSATGLVPEGGAAL